MATSRVGQTIVVRRLPWRLWVAAAIIFLLVSIGSLGCRGCGERSRTDASETPRRTAPAPPAVPTSARLVNLSRPRGGGFRVGDRFRLSIAGAPDEMVTVAASHDSGPMLTTGFGRTDEKGRFSLTGRMTAKEAGSWVELWRVGSTAAPPLRFDVKGR